MKLIDKNTLLAEIERRQKIHFNDYHIIGNNNPADYGACNALTQILDFIDTLEVKEVDLENIIDTYINNHYSEGCDGGMISDANRNIGGVTYFDLMDIAKHFYELGLKAQKGE